MGTDLLLAVHEGSLWPISDTERRDRQMGTGDCGLDGFVNIIWEGGPRREGLKISSRIRPWCGVCRTMKSAWFELCICVSRKREIREAGLHGAMSGATCLWSSS